MDKLRVILIIVNVMFLFAVTVWLIYDVSERIGEKKNLRTPQPAATLPPSPQGEGFEGASGKNNTEEE